jgi:hypothetical protein
MRKTTKYLLSTVFFTFLVWFALAQEPAGLVVEVEPSSFDVNVPVDVTIKVVKSNGDVVQDYDGNVYIDIDDTSLEMSDYDVPSEHLYEFAPQDQGIKKFSKWLVVKKAGTYTLIAYDINNDDIKGEKTIIVWGSSEWSNLKTVTINTPAKDAQETSDIVEILWEVSTLPNSLFEVHLNNQIVYQGMTDSVWGFTAYITWHQEGSNNFQIKILDANNVILGESQFISFTYTPINDGKFNSIQVLPSNILKVGEKATFRVSTSDTIASAVLRLSNWRSAPMDPISPGLFTKELFLDTEWKIEVSVDLFIDGQKQAYEKVSRLFVGKWTKNR